MNSVDFWTLFYFSKNLKCIRFVDSFGAPWPLRKCSSLDSDGYFGVRFGWSSLKIPMDWERCTFDTCDIPVPKFFTGRGCQLPTFVFQIRGKGKRTFSQTIQWTPWKPTTWLDGAQMASQPESPQRFLYQLFLTMNLNLVNFPAKTKLVCYLTEYLVRIIQCHLSWQTSVCMCLCIVYIFQAEDAESIQWVNW